MSDPVVVEVTVAAPADVVWHALRDSREIRRWFGWEYDGIEEEIDEIFLSDVSASEEERWLDTHGGGRFELEPRGDSTIVRITRAAPAGQAGWEDIYDEVNEGWLAFVQQLRFVLERHRGEDRRAFSAPRRPAVEPDGGEEWYRSRHQTGVVLEDGAALVVLMRDRVILSTYGLDEAEFERLRAALTG
jgi:hypothetical protein